jgi:hypothetical protein
MDTLNIAIWMGVASENRAEGAHYENLVLKKILQHRFSICALLLADKLPVPCCYFT